MQSGYLFLGISLTKKIKLMLTRRAKAYSSSGSVV